MIIEYWLELIMRCCIYIVMIMLSCCLIYSMPQIFYEFVRNYRKSHIWHEEKHKIWIRKSEMELGLEK